ncbi:hypothetical protein [Sphingomonas sp.]|uniref:hypothetical protein n=1 Tax=Sphingomonas sp. TaxID=28214 RepID=UPI001ED1FCB7|nr:hypothetical protein [Sphingomonas sp.]MBX3594966.1 hypothetical protein [Sphingomonas sp.]
MVSSPACWRIVAPFTGWTGTASTDTRWDDMRNLCSALLAATLAACSPAPQAPTANEATPAGTPAPVIPAPRPTLGTITLDPVGEAATGVLKGELRCAFLSEQGVLLFAAAGDADPASHATAVVARAGTPVALRADATGGFDAMRQGGGFAGGGLRISLTRGADRATGHEGSSHAATLSIEGAGMAPAAIDGIWECGP